MAGKNGGARPGAGRPKGSVTKPQLASYFTEQERLELIKTVKDRLKTNDRVLNFPADGEERRILGRRRAEHGSVRGELRSALCTDMEVSIEKSLRLGDIYVRILPTSYG